MSVEVSGPLFDGRAERALAAAEDVAASRAGDLVRDQLREMVRQKAHHDTGSYESNITVQRAANTSIVTDRGSVYGAWLEGGTRRNDSTGFPGWSHFRTIAQQLSEAGTVVAIMQEELDKRRGDLG